MDDLNEKGGSDLLTERERFLLAEASKEARRQISSLVEALQREGLLSAEER